MSGVIPLLSLICLHLVGREKCTFLSLALIGLAVALP